MLPPFVPPSARSASEHLPPITDYVIDPVDRSFEKNVEPDSRVIETFGSFSSPLVEERESVPLEKSAWTWQENEPESMRETEAHSLGQGQQKLANSVNGNDPGEATPPGATPFVVAGIEYSTTLPSIEEFVARAPYVERPGSAADTGEATPELVQLRHAPSHGTQTRIEAEKVELDKGNTGSSTEAKPNVSPLSEVPVEVITSSAPATEYPTVTQPTTVSITSSLITSQEMVQTPGLVSSVDSTSTGSDAPPRDWIDEERDAFDWQSVATLATSRNNEERALRDWLSTDWDIRSTSSTENVASILMQLARRVRSGELKIETGRGVSTEAALAAVLTSLLSEPDADLGSGDRD